ncbi:spore germination protein [Paenibacillus sp. HWE-109]|uniref:GerAB/ArcD/ProY family transporter n=1 Tax=Paenibacillus sp. HWE-109 TaxID=1306526 RepID=UPI001EE08273|nr:GerAB/ArcD/ProY family transporter [Paenibacillus sp. HWE-109]UKS27409.1 spore germination protein [Paenibacillus sp. HWE-109]
MDMRINGKQLFWLMVTMQLGMTILLTINPSIQVSKQDAWISTGCAAIVGVCVAFICSRMSLIYPRQTFTGYAKILFGRALGNVIIFIYFIFWYSVLAIILRQYAEFILATILPRTPVIIPMIGMLLVAVYVTYSGIEAIARSSELLGPLALLGITIPLLLSIKNIQIANILPIYADSSPMIILKGALPSSTFLGDCIMLIMLFGFVAVPRSAVKPALLGVGTAGFLTCVSTFLIISVFGNEAAALHTYPYFNLVRYISYFDFFQNLDSIVIAMWIVGVFVKVSLYFFVCTFGTAQWIGIQKWRKMMWFVAPAVLLLALVPRDFIDSSIFFPQKIANPYFFPLHMLALPLLMWGVAKYRNRKGSS